MTKKCECGAELYFKFHIDEEGRDRYLCRKIGCGRISWFKNDKPISMTCAYCENKIRVREAAAGPMVLWGCVNMACDNPVLEGWKMVQEDHAAPKPPSWVILEESSK